MEERREKCHEADHRQTHRTENGESITGTHPSEELEEAYGEKENWDRDFFHA